MIPRLPHHRRDNPIGPRSGRYGHPLGDPLGFDALADWLNEPIQLDPIHPFSDAADAFHAWWTEPVLGAKR